MLGLLIQGKPNILLCSRLEEVESKRVVCCVQVMWRAGVSRTSPEGGRWTAVSTPPGCEVVSISCGCTGLVWAVLFNGRALIRGGVTGITPTGQYAVVFVQKNVVLT